MKSGTIVIAVASIALSVAWNNASAAGDAARGAELFRQCAACHSMTPGEHLTGPSLAGIAGNEAGTVEGFGRYSKAMRESDVRWTEEALDSWLESPDALIPGTSMRIPGVKDAADRRDLIAYLESVASGPAEDADDATGRSMMGMAGRPRLANLRDLGPRQQVKKIRHCDDTYHVTLGNGDTYAFWEFNLRFKTDSSDRGPREGEPAILRSGMMGDRAFVIFSGPGEISGFIERAC